MKTFLALMILASSAFAGTINLKPFDQKKLAYLIGELPLSVRTRNIVKVSSPMDGIKVSNVFQTAALKIECTAFYYLQSMYFPDASCKITLDEKDLSLTHKFNMIQVAISDAAVVKALYETIPYGQPEKDFRGWERDSGTDLDGYRAPLFHFNFHCSTTQCLARFSDFNLVP